MNVLVQPDLLFYLAAKTPAQIYARYEACLEMELSVALPPQEWLPIWQDLELASAEVFFGASHPSFSDALNRRQGGAILLQEMIKPGQRRADTLCRTCYQRPLDVLIKTVVGHTPASVEALLLMGGMPTLARFVFDNARQLCIHGPDPWASERDLDRVYAFDSLHRIGRWGIDFGQGWGTASHLVGVFDSPSWRKFSYTPPWAHANKRLQDEAMEKRIRAALARHGVAPSPLLMQANKDRQLLPYRPACLRATDDVRWRVKQKTALPLLSSLICRSRYANVEASSLYCGRARHGEDHAEPLSAKDRAYYLCAPQGGLSPHAQVDRDRAPHRSRALHGRSV